MASLLRASEVIMPRKSLIRSKIHPYHVTARCNNREPFHNSLNVVWKIINQELAEIVEVFGCKIHAFILMPNHFHLLITTPNEDLGEVMQIFIQSITKKLNSNSRRIGRVFGARYHWSLIDHDQYYDCALKYVYRNPVKAKIIDRVEDYPYSTLKNILNQNHSQFPMHPPEGHLDLVPNQDIQKFITWLNKPFIGEQDLVIKNALCKTVFSPKKTGWKNKLEILEQFRSMNVTRSA
jgi:REP element-mobilizing transposase RayT